VFKIARTFYLILICIYAFFYAKVMTEKSALRQRSFTLEAVALERPEESYRYFLTGFVVVFAAGAFGTGV
jgi:hypothetical protein